MIRCVARRQPISSGVGNSSLLTNKSDGSGDGRGE
jgi:hypothetical protein